MWFWAAAVLVLLSLAYVVFVALTSSNLTDSSDDVPLLLLGAAALFALAGWWRDRARRSSEAEAERAERQRLEERVDEREAALGDTRERLRSAEDDAASARRGREELQTRLENAEGSLGRERYLRQRAEQARRVESDWRRDLHAEVLKLSRERGSLGDPSDIPGMVLRLARTMLGAEKGLLLSRRDEDADGKLDLLAAEGFEHDPTDSALVQRFAKEVVEKDRTLREDAPGGHASGADAEIQNLVAIPIYLQNDFSGVVVCANKPEGFDEYDDEVLLAVGDQAGAVLHNARLQGELRASYLATIAVLAGAIEVKDPLLRGHSDEVSAYVATVANRFELPSRRREELVFGSLLHDVGKIGISETILLKPADLSPEERSVVELHPRIGYRLVQRVPALREIAPAILHHHERFDGVGYPSGLRGEQIPLEARIICVADAFSAMISDRPYRERMTVDEACAELESCAGTQFDPEVVKVFVEEVRRNPPRLREDTIEPVLDAELEIRRGNGEPMLGYGSVALIDHLTLLYSRRHLHEVAHAEAQRAALQDRPFAVVLVKLSDLAEINASEGYAAGDGRIRAAARVLQKEAGALGGTACRYSGGRLAAILPDLREAEVRSVTAEFSGALGDVAKTRVAAAVWRPGDSGDAVVERARHLLDPEGPEDRTY
jgi:diguanylate cyclase (GGDEF)-like protein